MASRMLTVSSGRPLASAHVASGRRVVRKHIEECRQMRPSLPGSGNSRSALYKHTPSVRRVHVLAALEEESEVQDDKAQVNNEQAVPEEATSEAVLEETTSEAVPEAATPEAVPEEATSEDTQASSSSSSEDARAGFTAQFKLNVLWQDDFCAVAVDQVVRIGGRGQNVHRTPVTEYYFWPKVDAWEEMKKTLEAKTWITERDTILVLNSLTEIVTFWQEVHTKEEAKEKFGDTVSFEA